MRPHRFDSLSFVFGLLFVALGAVYLFPFQPFGVVSSLITGIRWAWPILIVGIGVAVLLTAFRRPGQEATVTTEDTDELSLDDALEELPPDPLT
jgi:hypothetical protein